MAEVDVHFGSELRDGFKTVNSWVGGGIEWLEDVQQFYRERSAIEKEYGAKLNALAKKYYEKKARKSGDLSVGATPITTPGSLESASMTTWGVQLSTLETRANEHERFSADLLAQLAEPLKQLAARCEDLRRQHSEYAVKLEKERDGTYADLRKVKGKYDNTCQEMESRRKKVDADHTRTKAQGQYQQQMSDMNNAKNGYLIWINVTNKQKEKYYHEYVPDLLDSLQDLSESRTAKLNAIWASAAQLETSTLDRSTDALKHLFSEIPRNNPLLDSMMFVRHNVAPWQDPADFKFEPSPVWLDDDKMASNEPAKVYLMNILSKSKSSLGALKGEEAAKRREVEKLKSIKSNIRTGKDTQTDEVEVARSLFALQESLHEVERRRVTAETEVSTITTTVGDISFGAQSHNFKSQTFKIPTNCDLCGERIWGLSAKGFDCIDCGFTCHSKCELKVPPDCPGEQNKEQRRRLKVERQEAARTAVVQEAVPERQVSGAPPLSRSDTVNSMNTLSSGHGTNPHRSVSSFSQIPGADEDTSSTDTKKRAIPAPPTQRNGKPPRKTGRMIYPYTKAGDGELTVAEGKEVTIIDPDDGQGWMKVRAGYMEGVVPASYVEVFGGSSGGPPPPAAAVLSASQPYNRPESTYSASSVSLAGSVTGAAPAKKKGPAVAPRRGAKKLVKHVEALYAYEARTDAEHNMEEGERLVLVNKDSGDGWADVEKNGVVKSVPANYIQEVD